MRQRMEALVIPRWMMSNETVTLSEEAALVERAAHDPEAMSLLFRQHHGPIARYLLRRTGNHSLAEDLTSEVFLTMVRYLPRYRQRGTPFRSWLYRLATNQVNRWARRQQRMKQQPMPELACSREGINHEAAYLRHALLRVPLHFQNALALHYLEELSVEEVATILGCALGTVKSRLARGREVLRGILSKQDGDQ